MILHKTITTNEFIYKWYDEDIEHYIIDEIWEVRNRRWLEFDYLETEKDLVDYMWHVMDDDTELYIIPADMVEWSPMQTWYFIY